MNDQKHAYVEITFNDEIRNHFHELVDNLVQYDSFYFSPVMPHINGNVADKLRLTLFFGLDPSEVENPGLSALLNDTEVKNIQLGKLKLKHGFRNLYEILLIEVIDNGELMNLSSEIGKFNHKYPYNFQPHLTLAYVNSNYEIPDELPEMKSEIKVEDIKVSLT